MAAMPILSGAGSLVERAAAVLMFWIRVAWYALQESWSLVSGSPLKSIPGIFVLFLLGLAVRKVLYGKDAMTEELNSGVAGLVTVLIAALIVFAFYAVTAPFKMFNAERQRATDAQGALETAKTQITALERERNDLKLTGHPPEVKVAPRELTPTEAAELIRLREQVASLKEQLAGQSADTVKKRQRLAEFMEEGQRLRGQFVVTRGAESVTKELQSWFARSLEYVRENLGGDYAARYRQNPPSATALANFPVEKMSLLNGVDARLEHLSKFIAELAAQRD
jgi:hypothetical protein